MRGWRGVGVVTGWQLVASLCFYAVFAATAFLREAYHLSRATTGLAVTAVMLGYTLFLFGAGAGVDAYGERPLMVAGLLGIAAGMVGVFLAPSYPLVLAALVVVGLAYASAMPGTNRAILDVAPTGRRNLAMNVKQVGVTVGSGTAAVLVTQAGTSRYGWPAGFLAAGVVAAVVAVGFGALYEGRPGGGSLSMPDVRGLLGDGAYRGLVTAGFFLGAAVFSTTGYVVLDMTEDVGTTAAVAGLVLAAVQVTGSTGRLLGGALADRLGGPPNRGPGLVLAAQSALAALCFLGVAAAGDALTAGAAFALLGLFILGFPGVYHATVTALVPDEEVGAATAGGQMALNLGGLVAPPAFGYVADHAGYDVGWTVLAGLAAVAAAVVWRRVAA